MKKIFNLLITLFLLIICSHVYAEEIKVERIMIETPSLYVETSKSMYMTANIYPSNATNKEVTWSSSDTSIATINASTGGLSTKNKTGVVVISATATDGSGVVGQVTLKVGYVHVAVGEEVSVGNSNWVSYDTVEWEIDDSTILEKTNKTGYTSIGSSYKHYIYVKGFKNGNTTVKMKTISGDILASNLVYVFTPLESITSDNNNYEIGKGFKRRINITYSPETVSDEFKEVHFTSDDSTIVSINDLGEMTGLNTGSTNVRVYSKYYEKSIVIPVTVVIYPNDIILSNDEVHLNNSNSTYQIEYEALPSNANDKTVSFTSENESIATVNKNGKIVAISNGETNIVVSTNKGNVTKKVHVVVSDLIPCTGITFDKNEIRLNADESYKLNYSLIPNNCTNVNISWKILDESIAKVDDNLTITGLKTGETILRISAENGLQYDININVNNYIGVNSFQINEEKIVVTSDGNVPTYQVNYEIGPSNATFKDVTWTVEDETIATVDSNGLVRGISVGKTKLIGTTVSNKIVDTIDIEVIKGYVRISWHRYDDPDRVFNNLRIYYPQEIKIPDYTAFGYESVEWYTHYENGIYSGVFDSSNYSYDGNNYDVYAKGVSPISVSSVTTKSKYYSTTSGGVLPIYYIFNTGEVPLNTNVKIISDDESVIESSSDWVTGTRTKLENGKYVFYLSVDFKKKGQAKLQLITEDGNHSDYITVNYYDRDNSNWLWRLDFSDNPSPSGANSECKSLLIKNGVSIDQFFKLFNIKDYYSLPERIYNWYFVDNNGSIINNTDTIINSQMKLHGVNFDNETVKEYSLNVLYPVKCNKTGLNTCLLYDQPGEMHYIFDNIDYFAVGKTITINPVPTKGYKLIDIQIIRDSDSEDITDDILTSTSGSSFKIVVPEYSITINALVESMILSKPKLSISKGNNNSLVLNWNQQKADKYIIYRSTNNKKWSKLTEVKTNSYTNSGLTYGKTYYYKIVAYNSYNGNTGYSNVVSKKVVPNKVNLKYSSGSTNNIKISWDKVSTTGYEIYRSTDNKKWSKIKTITKNSTLSFNNTKLKANKIYYYKVRAYKTVSGKKVYGSYSNVLKIRTAPVKPSFSVSYKDYNALNLNIGGVSGANTYYIHQSIDGKTYNHLTSLPAKGVLAQENLEVGKTYYYRLRACNSYNVCSGWVYANRKVTTKTPRFSLSTSSKKVTIKLNSVNMADGYEIYRSTSKKGKYTLVKAFTKDDELLFNNRTKKRYTYYYKVRSYILVNEKKVYSPFSGIKSIKSK